MGWREEKRLDDLPDDEEIEVSCRKCGKHRYEWARLLKREGRMAHLYMDEVQRALSCIDKHCDGGQRVAIMHDHLNESFVGGMP